MGASWRLLKTDRKLVLFPVLSGIGVVLVAIPFSIPLWNRQTVEQLQAHHHDPGFYALLFVFYLFAYLVTIFFNSALVACVFKRMDGGSPTVGYGLRTAWERFPLIFGWALAASTVGLILRMIEERVGFIGRLVVWFLGMAWSVTSFLVIPIVVAEEKGPLDAYRESVALLRRSWGEQIIGNVSFSLIFAFLGILPAALLVAVAAALYPPAAIVLVALGVVYLVALMLVQATLQAIYQAAVYRYAADGEAPEGFEDAGLGEAFRRRRKP